MKYIYTLLALTILSPALSAAEDGVIVANDYLSAGVNAVLVVVGLLFAWLLKLAVAKAKKAGLDEDVIDSVSGAVTRVYEDFVKGAKAAASDNRLTKEEAKQAKDAAIGHVMNTLKGPVKDYALSKGTSWLTGKIEDVISAKKAK